jgi:hypothetical protein
MRNEIWFHFLLFTLNDNFHSDSLLNIFLLNQLQKANIIQKKEKKEKNNISSCVCQTTSLKTSLDSNRFSSSSSFLKQEKEWKKKEKEISLSLSFSLLSFCLIMHLIRIGSRSSCTREKKKKNLNTNIRIEEILFVNCD